MKHKARRAANKARALGSDARLQGAELRYGGRTVMFQVLLNTDADEAELFRRVEALKRSAVLRGPKLDMVIVAVSEVDSEQAAGLWSATFGAMEDYVKREGKA